MKNALQKGEKQAGLESRINRALKAQIPPAARLVVGPRDDVRMSFEWSKWWEGPFKVTRIARKSMSVTDRTRFEALPIMMVLPASTTVRDDDYRHLLRNVVHTGSDQTRTIQIVEELPASDERVALLDFVDEVKAELNGLITVRCVNWCT